MDPSSTRFIALAEASQRIASTRSRLEKRKILIELLRTVPPEGIASVVGWLTEQPPGGATGIGPSQLWKMSQSGPAPAEASVTLEAVDQAMARARGSARGDANAAMSELFARLTEPERQLLVGSLTGSLRQGSSEGVMLPAIAELAGLTEAQVQRAVMVKGTIARAADAILGAAAASGATPPASIELFSPLAPMLASSAESLEETMTGSEALRIEWKVDGVRAQVHKQGDKIAIYSRAGNDITVGCASIVDALRTVASDSLVLDGEVVLENPDGRARSFQDSFSVIASGVSSTDGSKLRVYVFDCLHEGGNDLVDQPLSARLERLRAVATSELCMPGIEGATAEDAARFYADARARGHEGVMVKDLGSTYRSSARGSAWKKVKEVATVDLVVLAVEPGSGRRKGFLSNLHLGARREDGTFCMVGKTFKGLTDAMLAWQTERLGSLATDSSGYVVQVRPELVVEIRFNDVQRSPRYPGGIALRFARVVRYREDKLSTEIESLESLVDRLPADDRERAIPRAAKPLPRPPLPPQRQLSLFGDEPAASPRRRK